MALVLESIKNNWVAFGQSTVHIVLWVLALAWIFLYEKKKEENLFLWYTVFATAFVWLLEFGCRAVLHRPMMFKTFYLLPIAILLAYVGVRVFEQGFLRKNKWIIIVLYAIIIQAGIGFEYTGNYLFANYNDQKISSTVMKTAEWIRDEVEWQRPMLLAPEQVASQIQEYDATIRVAYGDGYLYSMDNLEMLLRQADEYNCDCIMVRETIDDEEIVKSWGYRMIAIYDGYTLYSRT